MAGETPNGLLQTMQQEDKARHIICSFMSVMAMQFVVSVWLAVCLVLLLGLVKELWDLTIGTGFSWYDIVANVVGVAFAVLVLMPGF